MLGTQYLVSTQYSTPFAPAACAQYFGGMICGYTGLMVSVAMRNYEPNVSPTLDISSLLLYNPLNFLCNIGTFWRL